MRYESCGFAAAVDDTRIFYEVIGSGPAVVLSDGIACDGFAWEYLAPHLAKKHRVIHWHYRGHGHSEPPHDAERIGVEDHAEDLLKVLDAADAQSAVLMGHSMGTQVCLEVYRRAPERVRAIALLCGSSGRITSTFHDTKLLERALPKLRAIVDQYPDAVRKIWRRMPSGVAFTVARLIREVDGASILEKDFRAYVQHVTSMEPALFLAMLDRAGAHDASDVLQSIRVPTLVAAAEFDTFTPPRYIEAMAQAIPGAEFLLVRGASHAAPVERADLLTLSLDRFLETVAP